MKVFGLWLLLILAGCASHKPVQPPVIPPPAQDEPVLVQPETVAVAKATGDTLDIMVNPSIFDVVVDCPGLPPVCPGLPNLLSQAASTDDINNFIAVYGITFPLTCRFQQPPRCYTGQVSKCGSECTP